MLVSKSLFLNLAIATSMIACGGNSKDESPTTGGDYECEEACVGEGALTLATDNKLSIEFPGSAIGQQYIVLPFSTGNMETINAANAEKPVTFTYGKAEQTQTELRLSGEDRIEFTSLDTLYKKLRTTSKYIVNRSSRKRKDKEVDRLIELQNQIRKEINRRTGSLGLNNDHKPLSLINPLKLGSELQLTNASCPAAGDDIALPEGSEVTIPADGVTAGSDFCLVFIDEPKAISDKATLQAGVAQIMKTYKETIYVDSFADKGSFKFAPIIIFVDSSKLEAPYDQLLGGFISSNTEDEERPILIMASDLTKVGLENDEEGRSSTYATLAHEIQHAISFYYKAVDDAGEIDTSKLEIIYLDEGIAHFMEDAFGYGEASFQNYSGAFLSLWPVEGTSLSFLSESYDQGNDSLLRGASQTFVYYLSSKMGGVSSTDGALEKGGGLSYVAEITKSKKRGAAALSDSFNYSDWTWTQTVGNYLGSLVVNGTSIDPQKGDFSAQAPIEVDDVQSTKNKLFGMKFNNYNGIADRLVDEAYTELTSSTVHYYESRPGLYTVASPEDKVVIELNDNIDNTAAMVVRVK